MIKKKNIAYVRLAGRQSRKQILDAFDAVVADKNYKDGMNRLWDFRDADLSAIASNDIAEMAQYSMNFPPGKNDVKVAFVTNRTIEFGLSRMFEMASEGLTPIMVFRSIEDAEDWLAA